MSVLDRYQRPLRNLRISVTDRCNLRCGYCMPEEEYVWLPKRDLLSFEELARLVDVFAELGVEKVRLTGGEPLLRRNLPELVRLIAARERIRDLALTTNAVGLADQADALRQAGLGRLSISLDTIDPGRYLEITRRDALASALAGIDATRAAGFEGTKINMVVMRDVNDDELVPMLEFGKAKDCEVRFIEYMDVGGATRWSMKAVLSRREILERLTERFGAIDEVTGGDASAPADRFRLADGRVFGIISSTTVPFCGSCDRSRLTADGIWYRCLYAKSGLDLRGPLRTGSSRTGAARRTTTLRLTYLSSLGYNRRAANFAD